MPDHTTDTSETTPTRDTPTENHRDPETMTTNARQTETNRATTDRPTNATLGDVSHTNPYTGRPFGTTQTYGRGRVVAADGGQANADPGDDDQETLEDVDHTSDDDVDGAQGTFDRGRKGPDDEPDDE